MSPEPESHELRATGDGSRDARALPGVPYRAFRPLYPPRPEARVSPASLPRLRGFIIQLKYDDIRTVVYFHPDSKITLLTRQREALASYAMTDAMRASLHSLRLPKNEFHVLDGGLLRQSSRRDRLVLWDILVYRSRYLVGSTYRARFELLHALAGHPRQHETETGHRLALRIAPSLWLAEDLSGAGDPLKLFKWAASLDGIEGFVLKDPNGKLERGLHERNNGSWQLRVRKPSANYLF
ncbi:MAG: hypothetical protein NDJ90_07230 [Oligoflexia bacterium]|nr:hypothetical protein [Oligoflexia bacterium]